MVYYNPNDNDISYLCPDVNAAIKCIEAYIYKNLQFSDKSIAPYKEIKIAQKRQGLMKLAEYLICHQYESSIINIVDDFMYKIRCRRADSAPGSEAYIFYDNIMDVLDDIVENFL